jgi:predicted DNA-binding protein (MmcQ/YjbR family)
MNLTQLRSYLLTKKATTEETPFGPENFVYKVMGKMFALVPLDAEPLTISLKCEPGQALLWRDVYPAVRPGYHMNKTHWNTVTLDGSIPEPEIWGMIDDSYDLVVAGLSRAQRVALETLSHSGDGAQ